MTLQEAVKAGHQRVRLPHWAHPEDYLLLDILLGFDTAPTCGPWGKLYSPVQLLFKDFDRPQRVLLIGDADTRWEPYIGPPADGELPPVDERGPQPDFSRLMP